MIKFIIEAAINFFALLLSIIKLIKKYHNVVYAFCIIATSFIVAFYLVPNLFYMGCYAMWFMLGWGITAEEEDFQEPGKTFNLMFYVHLWPYTAYRYGWLGSKHKKPIRPKKPRGK